MRRVTLRRVRRVTLWVGLLAREIFVRELGLGKKHQLNKRKKLCGIPSSLSTFVEPFLLCKVPCFHPVCLSFIYERAFQLNVTLA